MELYVGIAFDDLRFWSVQVLSRDRNATLTLYATIGIISIADGILNDELQGQDLLDCLTVLPIAAQTLSSTTLRDRLITLFPALALATQSKFAVVRYAVARCFAALCDVLPLEGLRHVVESVIPVLGDPLNVNNRRGAIELISRRSFPLSANG